MTEIECRTRQYEANAKPIPFVTLLDKIRVELQSETCAYFQGGWQRFFNTIETLVAITESGDSVLDLGGDVSDWLERPEHQRQPYSFGYYFRKAGFNYSSLSYNDLDLRKDRLPFDDDRFDVVTHWETIEHLWNLRPGGTLVWDGILHSWKEAHRVLKPGGIFFVATCNRFCPLIFERLRHNKYPQCYVTGLVGDEFQGGHVRELTGEELDGLAQVTGTYPDRKIMCRSSLTSGHEKRLINIRVDMERFLQRPLAPHELADSIYLIGIKE